MLVLHDLGEFDDFMKLSAAERIASYKSAVAKLGLRPATQADVDAAAATGALWCFWGWAVRSDGADVAAMYPMHGFDDKHPPKLPLTDPDCPGCALVPAGCMAAAVAGVPTSSTTGAWGLLALGRRPAAVSPTSKSEWDPDGKNGFWKTADARLVVAPWHQGWTPDPRNPLRPQFDAATWRWAKR